VALLVQALSYRGGALGGGPLMRSLVACSFL
jgi:hypothetical protein